VTRQPLRQSRVHAFVSRELSSPRALLARGRAQQRARLPRARPVRPSYSARDERRNTQHESATDCVSVGAIAHELGHGFGLPHTDERPNCAGTPSLMYEWRLYDGVGLCDEERTDLLNSGYYTP
jgi:hypothetical protein